MQSIIPPAIEVVNKYIFIKIRSKMVGKRFLKISLYFDLKTPFDLTCKLLFSDGPKYRHR